MKSSKKRNLAYFLVPALALIAFVVIYIQFDRGYEAAQLEKQKAAEAAKQKIADEQVAQQKEAVARAIADNEQRKKEKAAKDALDQKRRDDLQTAVQERDKALVNEADLKERLAKLKKEKAVVIDDIKKIDQDKAGLVIEKQAVDQVSAKALENAKSLNDVVDKIAAADRAAQAAAAAALQAKNTKKKS